MVDAAPAAPPPLPVGYYLENFQVVLDTVSARYDDLLSDAEKAFRDAFAALPLGARRLFVRLVSRRGLVFRRDLLGYPEVGDLDAAIAALVAAGLTDDGADLPLGERLAVLRRPELLALCRERLDCGRADDRRDALAAALEAQGDAVAPLVAERYPLVRPLHQDAVLVFRLLFFGNLWQDLSEFVLSDLGVVRYEQVELDRRLRRYPDRRSLDEDLLLRRLQSVVERLLVEGEVDEATALVAELDGHVWHPLARPRLDRVRVRLGRVLESGGRLDDALACYADAELPPARERRARVLAALDRGDEALELAEAMVAAPRDETEVAVGPRLVWKLRRERGEAVPKRPIRRLPRRRLEVVRDPSAPVEAQALTALGGLGFHGENWLWRSLFGLAFWDLVFAPIAGAFEHPFQSGPLDLHGPGFRAARATAIDERLESLRSETRLKARLMATWEAKDGLANAFVAWDAWRRPCLELALERIDGASLAVVCDRLARDPGRYRRGLPDLFVVRDAAPGFELLEVKAPGDQLRPEQTAWLDYLLEHGLPAAVLDVRWRDDERR